MKMKSKLIAMMSGLTLACVGATGSYAYFTAEASAGENKISMGKFPKANVKVFASAGPLYNDAFGKGSNIATENYTTWLDVASQYAAQNMIGNNVGAVGNDKAKFENLSKGSTVDVKSNIGTFGSGNTSWQGSKQNAGSENGNMVHYVVAIFNEANKGEEAGRKLNYKNEHINIERYDNFKGESGKTYKIRKEENVSLKGNEERIRTFDFDGTKFIQDGTHGKPSEDADLIIFDVGSTGYNVNGGEQKDLDKLNNTLLGEVSLFDENNNILWEANNPLYNLGTQMNGIDKKARLLNTVCNVSFRYTKDSSYVVEDSYTINMTGGRMGTIEEEKPKDEVNNKPQEESQETVKPQEKPQENVENNDKEENKKPVEETKPSVPENNIEPETPNNNEENTDVNNKEENKNLEEEVKDKNQKEVIEDELNKK